MSTESPRIRRAAKEHRCTERNYHTIKPGELYLFASCPPWHEFNRGKKWWTIKACLRCANEFSMHTSDTRKAAEALVQVPEKEGDS